MTTDPASSRNASCGCCQVPTAAAAVYNPPGLAEISYRIGTHPQILRRLLTRLSFEAVEDGIHPVHQPLATLTTRSVDDPAIALLDAWAVVGDVLTFYQERIANEAYLRTATERRSILELARLIGYELRPGVAASAYLAVAMDTATGAPASVLVPAGTRVQSVPGQDELPQTFETSSALTARVEWNTLRPRSMRPQQLAVNGPDLYLLGAGDATLEVAATFPLDLATSLPAAGEVTASKVDAIFAAGTATELAPGMVILLAGRRADGGDTATVAKTVRRVQAQAELDRTRIELDETVPPPSFHGFHFASSIAGLAGATLDAATVDDLVVHRTWSESGLSAWLSVQGWNAGNAVAYIYGAYSAPPPRQAAPSDPGAFAMRATLGFFGHNAPAFGSLTETARSPFVDWDPGMPVWQDTFGPAAAYYTDADCFLERPVPGLTGGGWAVFELPAKQFTVFRLLGTSERSLVGYGLSAKTTGLTLGTAGTGTALNDDDTDKPDSFDVRRTTAHVHSDRIVLAQLPIEDPLGAGTPEQLSLTLDRMVLGLREGQVVAVTGEREDLPGVTVSEVVELTAIQHAGGFTTLFFAEPGLTHRYVRSTVTLSANVVPATHGETVHQVLGSGNGAAANQTFRLRKPPLTYVPAATASGTRSSLEVRVDGVRWEQAARLYGSGASDEQYLVAHADDGTVSVVFGDGVQGARLPTGVENVEATYRSGIGTAGMVPAGSLTLLMTKPLGVASVTNPLPAAGAADPESRDDARANAPLTVLTLDRVVSLPDAENFARAFSGIGKAAGTVLVRGGRPWVHLTVAAAAAVADPGGLGSAVADHRVAATAPLRANLVDALAAASEPSMPIRVDTYQPVFFDVAAKVLLDPRHRWSEVTDAVTTALVDTFSFAARGFGQPVTTTEVVTTIQATPGVVFVDLDALHRFDLPATLPADGRLVADLVAWPEQHPEPTVLTQLLLVNPIGITLTQIEEAP
ncbi:putative baseplate assembly protein [Intrasporangium sp.]|uniref:putative baseplate assembly protein n=1 Tax=Intrasporangium sp. TaxID=1925024 RepID=UPI003221EF32